MNILILVFVHKPEDKMFLAMGLLPIEITTFLLEANNQSEIAYVEAQLTEKVKYLLTNRTAAAKTMSQMKALSINVIRIISKISTK